MTVRYAFLGCVVEVDDDTQVLVTRFPDGCIAPATPNDDPDSVARAHDLGYDGDTWAMSRDHELAHTWLGDGYSMVLYDVAHGYPASGLADHEEGRVLALQAALDKSKPRPWDTLKETVE